LGVVGMVYEQSRLEINIMIRKFTAPISAVMLIAFVSCKTENATDNKEQHLQMTQKVSCKSEEKFDEENFENIIPAQVNTCSWGIYKSVKTGYPDFEGHYNYNYQLYRAENGKPRAIQNADMFNDKLPQLEKKINDEMRDHLKSHLINPNYAPCFDDFELTPYSINEVGISFDDKGEMNFTIVFELGASCMSVDAITITKKFEEIEEYLK
jgi:hypothetical protein